jgi:hypothetical protein
VRAEFCEECHASGMMMRKRGFRDAGKHTAEHQVLCQKVEATLPTIVRPHPSVPHSKSPLLSHSPMTDSEVLLNHRRAGG